MDTPLVQQLLRPSAFDHACDAMALIETHISWVVLSGPFAYKIKKPVSFEFLDFSTLALRHHYCEREVELNRRFAPDLYLGVVPITLHAGSPRLHGDGTAVDYAVKMRRMNQTDLLAHIANTAGLSDVITRALAAELARLHGLLTALYPDPDGDVPGTPAALYMAMAQNFRQLDCPHLRRSDLVQMRSIRSWWNARFETLTEALRQRVVNGHIIEGHGDTHLGNIALVEGRIQLFDCIEFNRDFRVLDSIGEVALLCMDIAARGHSSAANRLISDYLEYSGDYGGLELLPLYQSYFAVVRAKVHLLQASQQTAHRDKVSPDQRFTPETQQGAAVYQSCQHYLSIAAGYQTPQRLFLAITHGVSGSGKSTLAAGLTEQSGAVRLRSDVERKRLAGLAPEQRIAAAKKPILYSRSMSQQTFDRLMALAGKVIGAGFPVIVDATFLHRRVRDRFAQLAADLEVPFFIIDCDADPAELRRRLTARQRANSDASDADIAVMENQLKEREPLSGPELKHRVTALATGENLWSTIQSHLQR